MPTPNQKANMEAFLNMLLEPFYFELNDEETRDSVVQAYYDALNDNIDVMEFQVVCDERNNTPESIDANELHVDVAIKHLGEEILTPYHVKIGTSDVEGNTD